MNDSGKTLERPVTLWTDKADPSLPSIPGYEMLTLLGRGGMGKVYKARDTKLNRIVALKMVTQEADDHVLGRFAAEVQAIAGLHHPHIAQIFESGQVEGKPFYTMEYLAGGSLADLLENGPLTPNIAAQMVAKIARALQHAHDQGIVHRDIKPGNILLEAPAPSVTPVANSIEINRSATTLTPKVADFGLAKRLQSDAKLTHTGDIIGTPYYMAPEQASGIMSKISPATDIYALGAILYECLTGRPPFVGPDAVQTVMLVLSMDPVPPRQLQPKLPLDLETICLKCLEKTSKKRYTSAAALADDLEAFLDHRPIAARPIRWWERSGKWARRNPWKAVALLLTLSGLLGLLISVLLLDSAYRDTTKANQLLSNANNQLSITNDHLVQARNEANQSYELTQQALNRVVHRISESLWNQPHSEKLMLTTFQDALALHSQLERLRPGDRQTTIAYAEMLYQSALIQILYRRFEDAEKTLQQTETLLQKKLAHSPDDLELQIQQVNLLMNRGYLQRKRGQDYIAPAWELKAEELLKKLFLQHPKSPRLLNALYQLQHGRASEAMGSNRLEEATRHYRQSLATAQKLHEQEPGPDNGAKLLNEYKSLALILRLTQQYEEADQLYRYVQENLSKVQLDERSEQDMRGEVMLRRAEIAHARQQWARAQDYYQQAERIMTWLVSRFPLYVEYQGSLLDIHFRQSQLARAQGKADVADKLLDQTITQAESLLKKHPQLQDVNDQLARFRKARQQYHPEKKP